MPIEKKKEFIKLPFSENLANIGQLELVNNVSVVLLGSLKATTMSTRTNTKTSLKKGGRVGSNFIALIPSPIVRQMLAFFFSGVDYSKRLY